ncbi:DNA polymerase ligase N-terminal domain-containing protein [Amycolatopsis sp. H20-H5]|uniref:DNA polymerase ligase N-terminal domain-containing protein n=1 Tax=Amycolatopsis sp. H20-H5 TaxID=3046309 RepID=UPI002DB906A9|nr:DNA polymerase ligase N-terminal domain-containing protein [Amycolatopsis sp. H20-H5]MEC3976702.1 DNA polymerase ligase N-terminal domain-containing protein [Amycolatopsis sp. H20-H5]
MAEKLGEYRRKRHPGRTSEPLPEDAEAPGGNDVFVIQEHHASRLHWDIRLERDGVLVSWAVPKGLPLDPGINRLAVHTEDHPMAYATFEGDIPAGEYGGGRMTIWDHGSYETLHWNDHKVEVVFHGERASGRYLFLNRHDPDAERDWMLKRLDPAEPGRQRTPGFLAPMLARAGRLPPTAEDEDWAYEFDWSGLRTILRVGGGRVTAYDDAGTDLTAGFPELRGLGGQLGSTEALLDGEVVVFEDGHPSPDGLRQRVEARASGTKRLTARYPAFFLATDLLHLDGHSCLELPYSRRRELLEDLGLAGPHWQVPAHYRGDGGAVARASREHGLAGILAKRADSRYRPGRRTGDWLSITAPRVQRVVIGGFRPGGGRRAATFGSLLLGIPHGDALRYVGNVGVGFPAAELESLTKRLSRLPRKTSPFHSVPAAQVADAHWTSPTLVGEVVFSDWTAAGCLGTPRWRGLLPQADAADVQPDG